MRFFRAICNSNYLEEIEGDLTEVYEQKAAHTSLQRLKWAFAWEVFLLLRPTLLRSFVPKFLNPFFMWTDYLKVSYRNLAKHKSYTSINILGLSAGIAAATLLFLVISYERSFDGFHASASQIYLAGEVKEGGEPYLQSRTPLAPKLKSDVPEVIYASRYITWYSPWMEGPEGRMQNDMQFVDADFADMFDFEVLEGDLKTALSAKDQLVITLETARRLFGYEPALGKEVREIQGGKKWVVGAVLEDRPSNTSIEYKMLAGWVNVPDGLKDPSLANWYNTFMRTYVVLDKNATPESLSGKLATIVKENFQPAEEASQHRIHLVPITELRSVQAQNKTIINLLGVVAVIILLIASVNFINLASAQSLARTKEVTIRKVIGSSRGQLIAQFLTESLMVNLGAVVVAWLMLYFAIPFLEQRFSIELNYSNGKWALLVLSTAGFALLLGLVSGFFPAMLISSVKTADGLKGKAEARHGRPYLRNGLLVVQFAASIFMVAGTIVVWKQINYMKNQELHFDDDQVLVVPAFDESFTDGRKARKQLQVLAQEYATVPGIQQVSFGQNVPGRYWQNYNNFLDKDQPTNAHHLRQATVSVNYFSTLGVDFYEGRSFDSQLATDSNAVVINRKAMELFGWSSIEGKQLVSKGDGSAYKVVGVTEDFHYQSLQEKIEPFVHFYYKDYFNYMLVRFEPGRMKEVLGRLENDWKSLNALQGFDYFFLNEEFAGMYREQERIGVSAGFFSVIALLIASLGLFSVASFVIRRKRKEISIRKVMGASVLQLAQHLTTRYLLLVGLAFVCAAPTAWWLMSEFLEEFAYRAPLSVTTFVVSGLLVTTFAVTSIGAIVWRASKENPVLALRNE